MHIVSISRLHQVGVVSRYDISDRPRPTESSLRMAIPRGRRHQLESHVFEGKRPGRDKLKTTANMLCYSDATMLSMVKRELLIASGSHR